MANDGSCVKIGILTLTKREDIDQFIDKYKQKGQIELCQRTLKFEDLLNFKPVEKWSGVILLHSAKLGRLSLTDVYDARYDQLLTELHSEWGKEAICIIAHDVNDFQEHSREEQLRNLKCAQVSAFNCSEDVIICEKLIALHEKDSEILYNFLGKVYQAETGKQLEIKNVTKPDEEKIPEGIQYADGKSEDISGSDEMDNETSESSTVVLVTDASGFIGSHIVKKLTQRKYEVRGVLDLETGTLESFEKGTLDNELIQRKIGMLKGLFPKLDLFEADIHHYSGWRKAVEGCTYVIHTSRFQDNRQAAQDDVTNLLQACQDDGGIERIVLTGGSDLIPENELKNKEWMSISSALKDAICKGVSEKAALIFMKGKTEKPAFGLSIIKPPVVLGPILCEIAEANVEVVRRRMVYTIAGLFDISIPVCDVRDVAEAHIMALNYKDAGHINHSVYQQRLTLKDMASILKSEFKDKGYDFPPQSKFWTMSRLWDDTAECLKNLYGNRTELGEQMVGRLLVNDPIDKHTSVIDMAYSCIEIGSIPKMSSYRPRRDKKKDQEGTKIN